MPGRERLRQAEVAAITAARVCGTGTFATPQYVRADERVSPWSN